MTHVQGKGEREMKEMSQGGACFPEQRAFWIWISPSRPLEIRGSLNRKAEFQDASPDSRERLWGGELTRVESGRSPVRVCRLWERDEVGLNRTSNPGGGKKRWNR